MSFTDEDLNKLKGFLSIDELYKSEGSHYLRPLIRGAIARLEAAERKMRALELHHDADNDGNCFKDCRSCKEITDSDQAWREAAGN